MWLEKEATAWGRWMAVADGYKTQWLQAMTTTFQLKQVLRKKGTTHWLQTWTPRDTGWAVSSHGAELEPQLPTLHFKQEEGVWLRQSYLAESMPAPLLFT